MNSPKRHWLITTALVVVCLVNGIAVAQDGAEPTVTIDVHHKTSAVHPGTSAYVALTVNLGEHWHVNEHAPTDPYLVPTELALEPPDGVSVKEIVYPEPTTITQEGVPEPMSVYGDGFAIGVAIDIPETASGAIEVKATLQYQACNDKLCLAPKTIPITIPLTIVPATEPLVAQNQDVFAAIQFSASAGKPESQEQAAATPVEQSAMMQFQPNVDWKTLVKDFSVTANASGYMNSDDFIGFIDESESGQSQAAQNPLAGKGFWFMLLAVVGGGLLLNLTPCVLPMIPINIAIIGAGAKAGSRSRGFLLGATYGTGMAIAYGALGLAVILGASKTFGLINSTPWFNGVIAIVFAVLALAMFDVFMIDFTKYQAKIGPKRNQTGSYIVAFSMGIVAALLAGACVAPVIISTIVYAQSLYSEGIIYALLLPFFVGIGMALPWPFAGAGLSFLPKPGKWMTRVKYAMGIVILVFAAYYGHLSYSLYTKESAPAVTTASSEHGDWIPSLEAGLAKAKEEGKPVILDFWATWCKNCLTMDATTFQDPKVSERLDGYVKIKVQAEDPSNPETKSLMEHFGVLGLPTYVILTPEP